MMRPGKAAAAGVGLLALAMIDAAGVAKASDRSTNAAYCHWYRQQAMNTGDEYWWDRWRRCLSGDDWDRPRKPPRR